MSSGADDNSRDKKVCYYCLDTQNTVCVCVGCRTKLEMAKEDLARLKRDLELRREMYWKAQRARRADIKRNVKDSMKSMKPIKSKKG